MNKPHLRDESGFSLIQLIMMAGLMLGTAAITLKIMDDRVQYLRIVKLLNRLDIMEDKIKNVGASQSAMFLSARSSGSPLQACLVNQQCRKTSSPVPFHLFNSRGIRVSGYFDVDGTLCSRGAECPIYVATSYTMECPNDAPRCDLPELITTHYTITPSNKAYARGFSFKRRTGTTEIGSYLCPDGELLRGVQAQTGIPICSPPESTGLGSTECDNRTVAFGITPRGELECRPVENYCKKKLALALVIDISGSMKIAGKINKARAAAAQFISKMKSDDEISVLSFSKGGHTHVNAGNKAAAMNAINSLAPQGGTNITAGLLSALSVMKTLSKSQKDKNAQAVVLLSDGMHNGPFAPFSVADLLQFRGIRVFSIGFGNDADVATLSKLAYSPSDFYDATGGDLTGAFDQIAEMVCRN